MSIKRKHVNQGRIRLVTFLGSICLVGFMGFDAEYLIFLIKMRLLSGWLAIKSENVVDFRLLVTKTTV